MRVAVFCAGLSIWVAVGCAEEVPAGTRPKVTEVSSQSDAAMDYPMEKKKEDPIWDEESDRFPKVKSTGISLGRNDIRYVFINDHRYLSSDDWCIHDIDCSLCAAKAASTKSK